jgi:DNA-binding LacI/PurR family transcriptional regulator
MAIGAIWELQNRDVKVPEQMSIIGMDDIEVSEMIHPELTTIKQPFDLIGRAAVNKIVGLRKKTGNGYHYDEVISPSLIVRKSTAPII